MLISKVRKFHFLFLACQNQLTNTDVKKTEVKISPKIKSLIVSPSIYHKVMGLDAMILVFWILILKPTFSLSSFTSIKTLFSSSSLSAIRVLSSAYLRLLILLLAILIPACASSSLAFCMMYSVYKLNIQGDNIQPWRTPFLIWNQSVVVYQLSDKGSPPNFTAL